MLHFKTSDIPIYGPTAITIGNFDGVHRGHQRLMANIVRQSKKKGIQSLVLSFDPHPREVFGDTSLKHILSPAEKVRKIKEMGVDIFVEYPFDLAFAQLTPEAFMQELLIDRLQGAYLTVGGNYRFGKKGAGNVKLLEAFGSERGILVDIEGILMARHDLRICSTNIREAIEAGDIALANTMLGHQFTFEGAVEVGKRIGHTIGFPTANLGYDGYKALPKFGVYVTETEVLGRRYRSVTNVGDNPTVNGHKITIETNIMGFEGDIYGKFIQVFFLDRIRGQKKFESLDALKVQIEKDSMFAQAWEAPADFL